MLLVTLFDAKGLNTTYLVSAQFYGPDRIAEPVFIEPEFRELEGYIESISKFGDVVIRFTK